MCMLRSRCTNAATSGGGCGHRSCCVVSLRAGYTLSPCRSGRAASMISEIDPCAQRQGRECGGLVQSDMPRARSSSPPTQVLATAARVWNSWSGAVRSIPDSLPIPHPRAAPHTAKDAGEGVGHAPSVRNSRAVNRRVSWPATLAAQHDEARVPQGDVAGSTRLLRQVR